MEHFLRDLLESAPNQANTESSVLAHHHEPGSASSLETSNGVRVKRVKLWRTLVFAPICPTFLSELNSELEALNPDILHIHMPNLSAFLCLFSKKARRIPWVVHWHADVLGSAPDWRVRLLYPFYRVLERALLSRASTVICTSPPYLDTSKPLRPYRQKCVVVPLGIKDLPEPERRALLEEAEAASAHESSHSSGASSDATTILSTGTLDTTLRLLCVGRLTYYKGHSNLIEAVQSLPNVRLEIVGEGELRGNIERQITRLGLGKRAHLLGALSDHDLNRAIARCDILCLPSLERTEAFGVVILEAARLGKPALVSAVDGSGMSWVVQHGRTGWVFETDWRNALNTQIQSLSEAKEHIRECGSQAYTRMHEQFLIESVALKIQRLYRDSVT
jgi:glycosyltransferase involved in cell wall biosynthesis